jgi:signal transduction histidine kinase
VQRRDTEFYVGLLVWLLEVPITYTLWFTDGDPDLLILPTVSGVVVVAFLFVLYLIGYLAAQGVHQVQRWGMSANVGLAVAAAATVGLSMTFFYGMVGLMALVILIQLAPLVAQNRALVFAVLVPALLMLLDVLLGKSLNFTGFVVYAMANVLALIASYRAIAERDAKNESEQLVRELKATQILLSATTKRDERLRIARDLHDVLGHQLTALSLQLEVASHVGDGEKQQHVRQAQAISGSLLSHIRETVSEFRQDKDMKLSDALDALVRGVPNLTVDLHVDFDESLVDARQVEVIFRCVQEALTNTVKHAGATHCQISVSNDEDCLRLVVTDDGSAATEPTPGNGLRGMAERVENIDGALNYENTEQGFVLSVDLPIAE